MGKTGIATIHAVHKLWVSTLNFQLLTEMNGPTKADDRKIIMVNPYVAFGCTNIFESGVGFHKIPCDKEIQKLWLIAPKLASHLI